MNSQKTHTTIISADTTDPHYWQNLWRYRELIWLFAWRDITVRYKQTWLGIAWVVLRPLLTMIVFTLVFNKLAKLPSGNIPYPVMVLTGMTIWQMFAGCFSENSNCIVSNRHIITKVYFPRIIIPISAIISNGLDFLVSLLLLMIFMIWYGVFPDWRILTLPLWILLLLMLTIGSSLWVAALMVKHRDLRFIVPLTLQFGLYLSPVGFSLNVIPAHWHWLYALNPMVGIIEGVRWALVAGNNATIYTLCVSVTAATILLISGFFYFKKNECSFVEEI